MSVAVPNQAEQTILEATARGAWADLTGLADKADREVSADFLRALLLGLPVGRPMESGSAVVVRPVLGPGVRVRGARIVGALDLAGCAGQGGGGLPGLALENCDLGDGIDLTGARLGRLSLKESRIGAVRLRGALLDGGFDFSAVRPAGTAEDAAGWIDAHGSVIHGEVLGDGSRLRAPVQRAEAPPRQARYALNLSDAAIAGSLRLLGKVAAIGGVSVAAARVRGDLFATDARMEAGEGDAFSAQAARIDGVVLLDGLQARGAVRLLGAKIGGTLQMNRADLRNRTEDGSGAALVADNAEIGGNVLLRTGFTAEGQVSLLGAKIAGNLECDGARFANRTKDGSGVALAADSAEIGGDVLLRSGFAAEGQISLLGTKIGSDLDCRAAVLRNHGRFDAAATLNATNARIDGRVLLDAGFVSVGYVRFAGCRIGRDLDCSGGTFIAWPSRVPPDVPWESALDATNLTVGGDVRLDRAVVLGRLLFEHTGIGGSLRWDGTRFPARVTVELPRLDGTTRVPIVKDGKAEPEETTWSYLGLVVASPPDAPAASAPLPAASAAPPAALVLAHAQIGAALQAYDLAAEVPLLIDLSAARAYTLDDDKSHGGEKPGEPAFPAGWGGKGGDGTRVPALDLDGFVYQRIEHFPRTQKPADARWWRQYWDRFYFWLVRGTHIAGPRLEWLARQQSTRDSAFFPQPYRQLASVMRVQGHTTAARQVAMAEQRKTPHGALAGLWRTPFGFCFGFGLAGGRATLTFLGTLALGTFMVCWAWQLPAVLVLGPARAELVAPMAPHGQPACGPDEIQPVFYALDMMLPVIPLHQEDRCEVAARGGWTYWFWQLAWALFSILGKTVATLTLITWSGILKPKDE